MTRVLQQSIGMLSLSMWKQRHTKGMAALLEVIEKRLAHASSAPFMLLFHERHVRGLRVAVAGYRKKRCAGEESRVRWCSSSSSSSRETRAWKMGARR